MKFIISLLFGAGLVFSVPAYAQVVRISETDFLPAAGIITFSEKALNTTNPVYAPGDYGGGASSPTVTFGSLVFPGINK